MAFAWGGSLKHLKNIIDKRDLGPLITGYTTVYNSPADSLINSWKESLTALCGVLKDPSFNQLQFLIELQMPVGAERADVLIIGGDKNKKRVLVIELKQWSGIGYDQILNEVVVPGIGGHQHPSIQTMNYVGKLKLFNSLSVEYELEGCVFMHNASSADVKTLVNNSPEEWTRNVPIYYESNKKELEEFLVDGFLPINLNKNDYKLFGNAPYKQTKHLFNFIKTQANDIANNVEDVLAEKGMGLTVLQNKIKNQAIKSLVNGEEKNYIIQGAPGSGKTLLAVYVLLNAIENGYSCIFSLRNNKLQAILKRIFDKHYPGASGLMMYFEPRFGIGIAQFKGEVDILIIDEAQRMEKRIISNVLSKARVCTVFLDETQRLNPPEQGTVQNFVDGSQNNNNDYITSKLEASLRCQGGLPYQEWIENFLSKPEEKENLKIQNQNWLSTYDFHIVETIKELIDKLKDYRSTDLKVALVASFTESPGNMQNRNADENIRVGHPLTSGFALYKDSDVTIRWLMTNSQYINFWLNYGCNNLTEAASIYGAQGFESDYVGVIWGRDLVFRNNQWELGDPQYCYDTIDRLITGRINKCWNDQALELVINRYRVFLTRGIKGIVIFCEDDETREYLLSL